MLTFWNKLVNTDDSRLIKKVFIYECTRCQEGNNLWCKDIKCVFVECNIVHLLNSKQTAPDLKRTPQEKYFVN